MKRLDAEAEARRKAFDLIPQLPKEAEAAERVLEFAQKLAEVENTLTREERQLAADLVFGLAEDKGVVQRAIVYARKLWRDHLAPGVIEEMADNEGRTISRPRLVRER